MVSSEQIKTKALFRGLCCKTP